MVAFTTHLVGLCVTVYSQGCQWKVRSGNPKLRSIQKLQQPLIFHLSKSKSFRNNFNFLQLASS